MQVKIPKIHHLFLEIERHPDAQKQVIDHVSFILGLTSISVATNMTLRDEYESIRGEVQIAVNELNELKSVTNQGCEKFGLHPNLVDLASLYNDDDLLFFTNTG